LTEIPDNPDAAWFARTLIELRDEVRALRDELRYAPSPLVPNGLPQRAWPLSAGGEKAAQRAARGRRAAR
jgi:hypothetical protein